MQKYYNQKRDYASVINCSKFHQVRIKTKKVIEREGGGESAPPWTERPQKKLGLDINVVIISLNRNTEKMMNIM